MFVSDFGATGGGGVVSLRAADAPSAGATLPQRPVQRWRGNPGDTALLFHDGEFPFECIIIL